MGKFMIKCPSCGTGNTASTGIFAKKIIKCGKCGLEIDIKTTRKVAKKCPNCKETFIYDQAKGKTATCPFCSFEIDAYHADRHVSVTCPQCACEVEAEEGEKLHTCPICDFKIDVQRALSKEKVVSYGKIDSIRYEGDPSIMVWKHPIEDFKLGSMVIVHESQEAIFLVNGKALNVFGPGKHTLTASESDAPEGLVHAEIYFVNKTVQMGMKWGTDSRVRFIDPMTGIPLDIGASGEMNLRAQDSMKLLRKLVGTGTGLINKSQLSGTVSDGEATEKALKNFFRAPLMTEIKSYLAQTIKERNLNIMEIDSQLGILSSALLERISPAFAEYGVSIEQFYVTYISLPEDDPNFTRLKGQRAEAYLDIQDEVQRANLAEAEQRRRIIEAQTEAKIKVIDAHGNAEATRVQGMADADVMHAMGYTKQDEFDHEVRMAHAENLGAAIEHGGSAADLAGILAGLSAVDGMFGGTPAAKTDTAGWTCSCGQVGNTNAFCINCGAPKPSVWRCACGHEGNNGKFCEACGKPRPAEVTHCPNCGAKAGAGKFCAECGKPLR